MSQECADTRRTRDLALEVVVDADDGALGDGGMAGEDFFHFPGGQPVARHVDDVVGAPIAYRYPSLSWSASMLRAGLNSKQNQPGPSAPRSRPRNRPR
jgi:hypothetical protein